MEWRLVPRVVVVLLQDDPFVVLVVVVILFALSAVAPPTFFAFSKLFSLDFLKGCDFLDRLHH